MKPNTVVGRWTTCVSCGQAEPTGCHRNPYDCVDALKSKVKHIQAERDEYRKALEDISGVICAPSRRGSFRRGAAQETLGRAFDALSWPQRQMLVTVGDQ